MIKLNIQRFGSTNKTTHYELSQFVSSDKPSWLNDINSDMSKIDTAINTAKTTADGAATAAGNAQTAAEGAQNTANTAVTNAATADGKAVTAQNNIGDLTSLTTTAKTSTVAAINELDEELGALSSLTTTEKSSIVAAINEVVTKLANKENTPVVLWSNANTGVNFDQQEITLSDSISNYDLFEIVCYMNSSTPKYVTSGEIPSPDARVMVLSAGTLHSRDFERVSGTNKILIKSCIVQGGNAANGVLIPVEILGYKHG